MSRLLPVHALFAGFTMVTVGGVTSPPPGGGVVVLLTVTEIDAVAVRPPPSVTVRSSVCAPFETSVVSHVADAVDPVTLWSESVVTLSCLSTKCVGEPCALVADMFTVTAPLTVEPPAGLVIEALSPGGGGGGGVPQAAPEATAGDVASL